ncbi:coiled-coil domain-containing protein 9B isoform X2 [Erinaceus europaeus]|uniref:Coiled-coil domain-containing protein 9B isoform X2 n=1 Tax=Erinaceus europaeus TaxID=9365 RepID=A0A1S3WVP3_ERIEU|nr:coiled-coil domain-containing protein 9B isoform X2 [Erinaceus europaeus]
MQATGSQGTKPSMTRQEEKDAELDRRIVALRKKNQALLRRYQGKRVVSRNWARSSLAPRATAELLEGEEAEDRAWCLGEWVELAVTMENKAKAKRIVSEKPRRARNQGAEVAPGAQSPSIQARISSDSAQKDAQDPWNPGGQDLVPRQPPGGTLEVGWNYMQWKQERKQVDLARLAQQQDAQGDWRRPWNLDKAKPMSQTPSKPQEEGLAKTGSARGPRGHSRKALSPALSPSGKGGRWGQPSRPSGAPATRSRARGTERLTGRARRWDETEDKHVLESQEGCQGLRRSLEEEAQKQQTEQAKTSPTLALPEGPPEVSDSSLTSMVPSSDLAPLDLSLGRARSPGTGERACVLNPELGAQQSPQAEDPQVESKVHICPESQRESGVPGAREDGQATGPGLMPQSRAPRGSGRARGTGSVKGRTRAVGPAERR